MTDLNADIRQGPANSPQAGPRDAGGTRRVQV